MPKTVVYQIVNNRIHFKCPSCQSKRMLALPPGLRRKSIRCQKCGELSHCHLNRRMTPRQSQTGKALMIFGDGKEIPINLYDISIGGVGFELTVGVAASIAPRQEIRLRCVWNPRLLDQGRYIIKNVRGRRIGAQTVEKRFG